MTDVLLSLTMPEDVAQEVEDLLLSRPDLVAGFTAIQVDGHGFDSVLSKHVIVLIGVN